ncbi:MAG: response regulator [Eubacterium sp.]|nr:response regulator [Eubacterium sp.]
MATAIFNGFNNKENCIYYEKTMVHELEIKKRIAEEATQAKSSFLANMSHEIRTPINAVLGMNEMILRESDDPNIIAYSESVRGAGNTLLGLINNILDFSKIEAGKMEINEVEYDLSSVANDLVNMISSRADEKGLDLVLNFDPEIPKVLYGDELRVKQVITNILTNSVKYTERGTVTFELGYKKDENDPECIWLEVAVTDTGIGIKEEDLEKLFSQFDRIEENRNRNIEGTGLGMSITQKLLDMMGASMHVESTYGSGSKFSFALKQKVIRWEELGDYEASYRRLMGKRKNYREKLIAPEAEVLVIDDNPMNLMVFKFLLKQTQVKIDTANDGDEGLSLAHDKKYDIIFFDHMMPGKDGIETLHEMRAQKNNPNLNTPSICLTANAISGAKEQYINAGFDDYLTKPVDTEKLEQMLIRYLPEEKAIIRAAVGEEKVESDELPDELKCLQGQTIIDLKAGLKSSGTIVEYMPLLKVFYSLIDKKAAEIDDYYKSNDIKNYTIKVHALKSSARLIGAFDFGNEAQRLEDAGKSEDMRYIGKHHEPLMQGCRDLKKILDRMFDEKKEEKNVATASMMAEVYEGLKAAADDMDSDGIDFIMEEMQDYSVPKDDEEKYMKLKEAAENYDYDAILRILS